MIFFPPSDGTIIPLAITHPCGPRHRSGTENLVWVKSGTEQEKTGGRQHCAGLQPSLMSLMTMCSKEGGCIGEENDRRKEKWRSASGHALGANSLPL